MAEELSIIVGRCLDGQQSAFSDLIDRFRGRVYGLCYRMLGQREDAEDATCLLYTSPSPRDKRQSRMPSSA